ncbi:low-density lipoprotein receptor-related protein 8 [Aplysia californica]|uniref:Low-density lipoprotein receptor-related protein 8 n=1 Tax=Aplysia californica TaxID=6500 RepID=A0ABM0K2S2_APLCA|nr:low-density lipoprotein receptor-related protein 8 [Aplysia californica]XP_035828060.1 low-density lipoprotein receptor-related protein 8 [Aplysia californica]
MAASRMHRMTLLVLLLLVCNDLALVSSRPQQNPRRNHRPGARRSGSNRDICGGGQFRCGDNSCIPYFWRCDEDNDCPGAEDERDCPASG